MLRKSYAVTTARNGGSKLISMAERWAQELGVPLIKRSHNQTLDELLAEHGVEAFIVAKVRGAEIYSSVGSFSYHPNMAALRILEMQRGSQDNFVRALELEKGMRVLDCTLGLAADAAVAAYTVGATGRVVGLEASPLVHFAVRYGLQNYVSKYAWFNEAIRRIETVNSVAEEYLEKLLSEGAAGFDVVYFDPMFQHGVQGSVSMDALRPLAYEAALNARTIELALKIAPKVVIKERSEFQLKKYACKEFVGGKSSRVKFGIIRA